MIDVDPEIVEICKKRVIDHIKRVKFFYNKLVEAGVIPEKDIDFDRIAKHDADKLEPYNLKRQACRFTKTGTVSPEQKEAANDVIREHIKKNPHHSEFWGAPSDDQFSTNIDCSATQWVAVGHAVSSLKEEHVIGKSFSISAKPETK